MKANSNVIYSAGTIVVTRKVPGFSDEIEFLVDAAVETAEAYCLIAPSRGWYATLGLYDAFREAVRTAWAALNSEVAARCLTAEEMHDFSVFVEDASNTAGHVGYRLHCLTGY